MKEPAIFECLVTRCTCTECSKAFAVNSNVSELIIAVKDTLERVVNTISFVSFSQLVKAAPNYNFVG